MATFTGQSKTSSSWSNTSKNSASFSGLSRSNFRTFGELTLDEIGTSTFDDIFLTRPVGTWTFDDFFGLLWTNQTKS